MTVGDVQLRAGEGASVARVVGEVDISNARDIAAALEAGVDNRGTGLVVDLTELGFLDSSGIGVLFGLGKRLAEHRQQLRLVVPSESPIRRVLGIVRIERVAPLHETVDEALAAIRSRTGGTSAAPPAA